MNKHLLLLTTLCYGSVHTLPAIAQNSSDRPNIIWISTEDLSPRWGCYNDPVAQTPNIDRIAAQGVRYTNAFTTAAISAPVRAGIITGMYQTSIGCQHMRTTSYMRGEANTPGYTGVPPHYVKAFTEYLRTHGYYCSNNSKTDYQFASSSQIPASIWDACGAKAHFANREDKSQPFFAVFNFTGTHESKNFNSSDLKTDPASVSVAPYYVDTENTRRSIAKLYDNVSAYDDFVGKRIKELEEQGLLENTIIFLWGDHGDGFGRGKRWLYDSGTNIPLVVKLPNEKSKGSVSDRLVSSIDFGPTVLSLANVPIPTHMEGKPFLGKYDNEERSHVYAARDREDESYDMVRMVRSQKYLYLRNFYPNQPYVQYVPYRNQSPIMNDLYAHFAEGKLNNIQSLWFARVRPPEELYDVKADPHNINNLATNPRYANTLKEMRTLQTQWGEDTKDQGLLNEDEVYRRIYPNGVQPKTNRPYYTVNCPEERVRKYKSVNSTITAPAYIDFYCSTQGASIVYRINPTKSKEGSWKLYNGAVALKKGKHTVQIKAQRYGYSESTVLDVNVDVR